MSKDFSCKDSVESMVLLADVLKLMNKFQYVPDEDSCSGMAFFSARLNEDSFYILKNKIEKYLVV